MSALRSVLVLIGFVAITALIFPIQGITLPLALRLSYLAPMYYHRVLCWLLDLRVEIRGQPVPDGPVLFVANHASWLDIPVLSVVEPVSFIAKEEVGRWPFFGSLARLQRTVFIARARRSQTLSQRDALHERLAKGDRLILFPEGTSGDGNHVLPFNSALFSVAEMPLEGRDDPAPLRVQPISVAYARYEGLPMPRAMRPKLAWYGDMSLLPHLWEVFRLGPVDVIIHYHEPVTLADFGNRKALAAHCHVTVAAGLAAALSGRLDELPRTGRVGRPVGSAEGAPQTVLARGTR